jgi:hypothetical protein
MVLFFNPSYWEARIVGWLMGVKTSTPALQPMVSVAALRPPTRWCDRWTAAEANDENMPGQPVPHHSCQSSRVRDQAEYSTYSQTLFLIL